MIAAERLFGHRGAALRFHPCWLSTLACIGFPTCSALRGRRGHGRWRFADVHLGAVGRSSGDPLRWAALSPYGGGHWLCHVINKDPLSCVASRAFQPGSTFAAW